jgi:hypothetical protein
MVSINGSVPMSFAASEEPTAYGELVSIGGTKLSVSRSRFYIKFDDVQVRRAIMCFSSVQLFSLASLANRLNLSMILDGSIPELKCLSEIVTLTWIIKCNKNSMSEEISYVLHPLGFCYTPISVLW